MPFAGYASKSPDDLHRRRMGRSIPPHAVIWRAPGLDRRHVLQCRPADFTGIFTAFCLIAAAFGSVIFNMPLEKSVFTDLGSGSNGRVIERANLPNVRR